MDTTDPTLASEVCIASNPVHRSLIESKLVFSSRVILSLSLYLAKLSLLFLLRRIFIQDQKRSTLICDVIISPTVAGGIASILISCVGCSSLTLFAEHCHKQVCCHSFAMRAILMSEDDQIGCCDDRRPAPGVSSIHTSDFPRLEITDED